jgi:IgGFc binding protein
MMGACCGTTAIDSGDPTGTLITSNKPIMVTSGAGFSMIDSELTADHLNEALPRTDELGTKYVIAPSANGDFVKIVGMAFSRS